MRCPVCHGKKFSIHYRWQKLNRTYYRCAKCEYVFLDPKSRLTSDKEKEVYDLHKNHPDDANYRHFLNQAVEPLEPFLKSSTRPLRGLDFGCGPGPALHLLLEEHNVEVSLYDPFYFNRPELLKRKYDLITCTEVIEHVHDPKKIFFLFAEMLKTNGRVSVMTHFYSSNTNFSTWHYVRDPTHVGFFSKTTFRFLASAHQMEVDFYGERVALLKQPFCWDLESRESRL